MENKIKNAVLKASLASMTLMATACSQRIYIQVWEEEPVHKFVAYMGPVWLHYNYAARHMRDTSHCPVADASLIGMLAHDTVRLNALYNELVAKNKKLEQRMRKKDAGMRADATAHAPRAVLSPDFVYEINMDEGTFASSLDAAAYQVLGSNDAPVLSQRYYSRVLGRRCHGRHVLDLIYSVQIRRAEIKETIRRNRQREL